MLWPAEASDPDEAAKAEWHAGMSAMAALPHVVVQLDELNWAIPGWFNDPAKVCVYASVSILIAVAVLRTARHLSSIVALLTDWAVAKWILRPSWLSGWSWSSLNFSGLIAA